jgi:DNA repair ATPase RecN
MVKKVRKHIAKKEQYAEDKLSYINNILSKIPPLLDNKQFMERIEQLDRKLDEINARLDNINYGVFKLKLRSADIVSKLQKMDTELKKLEMIGNEMNKMGKKVSELDDFQRQNLIELNEDIPRIVELIRNDISQLPQSDNTELILEKLQDLEQSKAENWFNRIAGLSSIISLALQYKTI